MGRLLFDVALLSPISLLSATFPIFNGLWAYFSEPATLKSTTHIEVSRASGR